MNNNISVYGGQSNTHPGIWRPVANSNLIGLLTNAAGLGIGLLVKVVNGSAFNQGQPAAVDLPSAVTDIPTDLYLDDGSAVGDATNQGKFVSAIPLEAVDQFRVQVMVGGGNAGDLLVLAPSPNFGSLQPFTGSAAGTYNRVFQALEPYVVGQNVLVRKYPGTLTH